MRNRLTILLLIFFVFSSVKFALTELSIKTGPAGQDEISLYEKRFSSLQKVLSPNATIGYVTDIPGSELISDPSSLAKFYVTQYAIGPIVVVNTTNAGMVLGNFTDIKKASANPDLKGLIPRIDLGNGVILFSKEER